MLGVRILVVDDEEANREMIREALSYLGHRIELAADGEEALDAIERELPDIILCDVVMPRCDGYTLCRKLKSNPITRLIPIIMLTSLDQLPDKIKAMELGADDYLTKPFNVVELTTRVRSLLSLKHFTDEFEHASRVLESIALVVESRDRYTGDHCRRLGRYGTQVGQAMGLGNEDLKSLWLGGIFHDLGKIAVSDAVLNKPGRLDPQEIASMRTHPTIGADLCRRMRTMEKIVPLIRHHHEKLDGSGYPDGLQGAQIPLLVRILTVVDVYDALATTRPYREALSHAKCMEIMGEEVRRGWWDPHVLDTLDRCLRS